ncbi:MAG: class I SAM-dependent methyltransferase [Acidobacteriota bacterium]|nr:class I SAM-dependent methyltransferase [Acidobacteriota bacterium]
MTAGVAVLYPRREYDAVGEWYATRQAQLQLLHADGIALIVRYDPDEVAADVVADVAESHALVVLEPLVVVRPDIARQLQTEMQALGVTALIVQSEGEPLLYFCDVERLRRERRSLRRAIEGGDVATSTTVSASKWRSDTGPDLERYVPATARSLLHVGCGDGSLGERIRKRQRCRVVGIETSRQAAALAKRRLDDVYTGEVEEVIAILHEEFDCIVASGTIEHSADPWSLLASLRRISSASGLLITSVPNVATARTIADLIAGHFDVAKQVRFFTRASLEELMDIAGWRIETMDTVTDASAHAELPIAMSDDLLVTRFTVVARRNERA